MPAPYSRTHPKIHIEDLAPDAPGHLLSLKEHKYVRTLQLRHSFASKHKSLTNVFLTPSEHPTLSHPVFIGEKGETIAIYQKQQLGKGAYGTVYLGINLDTGEIHAIKYQTPKKKSEMAQVVVEDKILDDLGTLIDRTVTTALGAQTVVSAQKLAWGENMRSFVISKKSASPASASSSSSIPATASLSDIENIEMAIQLLEQIDSAHQKGYVHRDIKLENAMWDEATKTATLIDFGISKKMTNGRYVGKEIEGTPHIVAPELYARHTDSILNNKSTRLPYTPATDMYAAGIALVELASERNPNLGIDKNGFFLHAAGMSEVKQGIAPKLLASAPDILVDESPDPLKNAFNHCIRKMLEADPEARITFAEALTELRAIKAQMEERAKASITEEAMPDKPPSEPEESATFDIQDIDVLAAIDALQSFAPEGDSPAALELSQNELEAQLRELSEFMDHKPSPYIFEAESVPSVSTLPPADDAMSIEITDPDYKALYETVNDFIESNKENAAPSHSSRKSFLLSGASGTDKVEFINDLKQMQRLIAQCNQTSDITQNSLLLMDLSDLIVAMRGKNYAAGLKSVNDTQKSSQFGFTKSLDQLLQYTGVTIQQKLESTPQYENGRKAKAKGKAKAHRQPGSPEEHVRNKRGRGARHH